MSAYAFSLQYLGEGLSSSDFTSSECYNCPYGAIPIIRIGGSERARIGPAEKHLFRADIYSRNGKQIEPYNRYCSEDRKRVLMHAFKDWICVNTLRPLTRYAYEKRRLNSRQNRCSQVRSHSLHFVRLFRAVFF